MCYPDDDDERDDDKRHADRHGYEKAGEDIRDGADGLAQCGGLSG
jgi:hypothetical protein